MSVYSESDSDNWGVVFVKSTAVMSQRGKEGEKKQKKKPHYQPTAAERRVQAVLTIRMDFVKDLKSKGSTLSSVYTVPERPMYRAKENFKDRKRRKWVTWTATGEV